MLARILRNRSQGCWLDDALRAIGHGFVRMIKMWSVLKCKLLLDVVDCTCRCAIYKERLRDEEQERKVWRYGDING
jgi:hypothetical protein